MKFNGPKGDDDIDFSNLTDVLGKMGKSFAHIITSDLSDSDNTKKNNNGDDNTDNDNTDNDNTATMDIDDAEVLSNLGNSISSAINHFQTKEEDIDSIRDKVLNSFSESGVDKEFMAKCFNVGVDCGEKISKLETEYEREKSNTNNDSNNNSNDNLYDDDDDNTNTNKNTFEDALTELLGKAGNFVKELNNISINESEDGVDQISEIKNKVAPLIKKFAGKEEAEKFEKGCDINIKIQECFKDFGTSNSEFKNNKPKNNIRYGLIDESIKMIEKQDKISKECSSLMRILTPEEFKILQLSINIPVSYHLDNLSNNITNKIELLESKIDDIALDLELIRNKK